MPIKATTDAYPKPTSNAGVSPTSPSSSTSPKLCSRLAEKPVILDCQGSSPSSYRSSGTSAATALHIVSVYETRSDHSFGYHPTGSALVDFALPGANVLVLSSYEPTHWTVSMARVASLEKIITIGYHQQTVTLVGSATNVPVQPSKSRKCGYSLPYNGGGCDTDTLISTIRQETGLPLASFDGCYRATRFKLHPNCSRSLEASTRSATQNTQATPIQATSDAYPKPTGLASVPTAETLPPSAETEKCGRQVKSPVILDCATSSGYSVSSYRSNITMGTALHVVSIYESRSSWSHLRGRADIDFQLPGSNVLVISSYEPTDWYIQMSETASLDKIVSFGYYQQRFFFPNLSPSRKPVIRFYGYQNHQSTERVCGSSTLRRDLETAGCGLNRLNAAMEAVTGLKMTSFHGCYRATKFRLQPQPASFCPNVATGTGSNQEDRHTTTLAVTTRLHAETLPPSVETEKCGRQVKSPVILDCATSSGYSVSSYRSNITMGTALHVVSIYESRSSWRHERGRADIDFQLPGSNVLVISSYEPTDWHINFSETASLDKIISFGYYQQQFFFPNLSPARKPVIRFYGYQNHQSTERVCRSSTLPINLEREDTASPTELGREGCGLNRLNAAMEAMTELKMTSFYGCYRAAKFQFKPQPASFCPNVATGTGSDQEDRHTTTLAVTTNLHAGMLPQSADTKKCDRRLKSPVILDCATSSGYTVSLYHANITMGTALHVVSIYESLNGGFRSHPRGRADIDFQLPGSNVLVLSSYEPTDWYIHMSEVAYLDLIISFGYYGQQFYFPNLSPGPQTSDSSLRIPESPKQGKSVQKQYVANQSGERRHCLTNRVGERRMRLEPFECCHGSHNWTEDDEFSRLLPGQKVSANTTVGIQLPICCLRKQVRCRSVAFMCICTDLHLYPCHLHVPVLITSGGVEDFSPILYFLFRLRLHTESNDTSSFTTCWSGPFAFSLTVSWLAF